MTRPILSHRYVTNSLVPSFFGLSVWNTTPMKSCTLKCQCSSSVAGCHCQCLLPTLQCSWLNMHSLPGFNSRHREALNVLLELRKVDWPQRTESCLRFIYFPSVLFRNHAEPKSALPSGHNPVLCGRKGTATSCSSSLPHLPKDADPLSWLTLSWTESQSCQNVLSVTSAVQPESTGLLNKTKQRPKPKPLGLQLWGFFCKKKRWYL